MNVNKLMPGDWVARKNVPSEHLKIIDIFTYRNLVFTELDGMGVTEKVDNLEGIQITKEILEKNGFKEDSETNGIYWRPDCRKFCIVKELDTWYFAFRVLGKRVDKSSGYICISECNYVHKLQHKLKDLEIEKEIVL